ncbi:MAG: hypothetical protein E4G99_10940, partial [Anaerolineales bacterium]
MDRKLLKAISTLGQTLLGVAILYAIARYIVAQWTAVQEVEFALHLPVFITGLLTLVVFYFLYTLTWQRLIGWLAPPEGAIRKISLHRIFFNSLLTRYLPAGKIWNISSRI